jgi:hypothetical protein
MAEAAFIRKSFLVLGGLLVWAAHFGFVYVLNALACARNFQGLQLFGFGIVPAMVALATALAVIAVLVLMAALRAPDHTNDGQEASNGFLRSLAAAVAFLSLIAIGWSGLPALLVPPCG